MKQYGGADIGSRTMLDALLPAGTALVAQLGAKSPIDASTAAVDAARSEAESTRSTNPPYSKY